MEGHVTLKHDLANHKRSYSGTKLAGKSKCSYCFELLAKASSKTWAVSENGRIHPIREYEKETAMKEQAWPYSV